MREPVRDEEPVRIQKFLSQAGVASRREAERMVEMGRVTVNDQVVEQQGVKVVPGVDRVSLDGKEVFPAETLWVVYHKPEGVLCTRRDPHGGTTVYDVLPDWAEGLRYVGRLDRDTGGLLVLTNDGDRAARMAHPSGGIEREYRATVHGKATARTMRALKRGVELDDGPARPKRVRRIDAGENEAVLSLVLTEGRKREVRRLLKAVGHPVKALTRVRFGPFELGDLPSGSWRAARPAELESLRQAIDPVRRDRPRTRGRRGARRR